MNKLLLSVVIVAVLGFFQGLQAQTHWHPTPGGPHGGAVTDISYDSTGRVWLSFGRAGVWYSEDNGQTWQGASKGIPDIRILRVIASSDGYIYSVGIQQEVIYRLNTNLPRAQWIWEKITGGFDKAMSATDFVTTPSGALLVASGSFGLLRTTDHGDHWDTLSGSIAAFYGKNPGIKAIARGKDGEYVTLVGSTQLPRNIWRSEDDGKTWTKLETAPLNPSTDRLDVQELAIANNGNIIVSTTYYEDPDHNGIGGRLITSSDTGKTWSIRYERPFPFDELEKKCPIDRMVKVGKSGMIYANGHGPIMKSMDGITWDTVDTEKRGDEKFMMSISPNEDHIFQMSEPDGVFRSDDGGKTWADKNNGLHGYMLYNIGINSHERLFSQSEFGLHNSIDDGYTWSDPLEYERESYINTLLVAKNDYVYVGCDFALFRSTDDGTSIHIVLGENSDSVTSQITGLAESGQHSIFAAMHETKRIGTTGNVSADKLMRSTNNGNTWDTLKTGTTEHDDVLRVAASGDTVFIAGNLTQSYRISTNNGATWNSMPSANNGPQKILMHTDGSFLAYFNGAQGGCWRLEPGGTSWTRIFPPEGFTKVVNDYFGMDNDDEGTIFICTDNGVFRSSNPSFSQWEDVSSGLVIPNYDSTEYMNVSQICKDTKSKKYYAAVRGLSVFESVPELNDVRTPSGYTATASLANYPNPFATTTTINFHLETLSSVQLDVYDVMGHRVSTQSVGRLPEGDQAISFDAAGLSSGNYLAVVRAGSQVLSTWMTITK